MTPETVRRATEPFFTTKPAGSGTGLGLAQVYGIVNQSGGNVSIDSDVGKGTIVTIELPGCSLPPERAADPADPGEAGRPTDFRVLVCDDDDAVRGFVARTLEEAGYAVEAVADGRTAIEAIRNGGHDMLVVDFAMQGMNGAEVARQVRGFDRAPALLMITGYADTIMLDKMGESVPMLRKPFDGPTLLAAVRRSLDSPERKAEA
jgi:CheY-like chemotaxis protein